MVGGELAGRLARSVGAELGSGAARELAATVRVAADDVRGLAAQAESAAAEGWRSTSAEAFRERLAEEVASVRLAALRLDDAAAAVSAHAAAVDRVLDAAGDVLAPVLGLRP